MNEDMDATFALVNCSQLVTLAGPKRPRVGAEMRELSIIENGAMLVRDGLVERTGTRVEIEKLVGADCEVFDAGRRVVMPGFVDAHTHTVFAGNRADEFERRAEGASYEEIAAAGGGIRSTMRRTRAAGEDELLESALGREEWFLRTGTTTVEAKSGYGLTVEDELKMLRVVRRMNAEGRIGYVPTFLGAHEVPDEYRGRRKLYVELITNEMLPRVASQRLAEFCDVFCEARVFTVEESRRVLDAARALGLGLRVHADQLSLSGGALLAAELKAKTADHLEHADGRGIAALKSASVQPVLLPGSVYALGSTGYPAARAMIEAGLAVVLATDFNPGSSPTPSMTMILSLASTHMKLTPAESLTAATVNAAYSLNRGGEVGTLEAGKRADFVVHDCQDYRELSYFFGVEHARTVFVGGREVFSRVRAGACEKNR
ncbi:MAG TPA: imidazolonepropionase [Pyrinomonadaceae bacterium]|nr:imidazolonepropionase [Pyrinomonadaceae bacterium]